MVACTAATSPNTAQNKVWRNGSKAAAYQNQSQWKCLKVAWTSHLAFCTTRQPKASWALSQNSSLATGWHTKLPSAKLAMTLSKEEAREQGFPTGNCLSLCPSLLLLLVLSVPLKLLGPKKMSQHVGNCYGKGAACLFGLLIPCFQCFDRTMCLSAVLVKLIVPVEGCNGGWKVSGLQHMWPCKVFFLAAFGHIHLAGNHL